jgi:glycosyltransferase involved in cell wall biosynthesis
VSVPGRVDDATLQRLLATAAVVAVPSVYEGFGLPVLEAMAVGVPVVAAEAASLPAVAGDAAVLVAADDTGALAVGLAAVLSADALAARASAAGRDRAERFKWEATAAGLVGLYERVAGGV